MKRRKFILTTTGVGVLGLAGCVGDGDSGNGDDSGNGNGNGNGDDSGNGMENGDDGGNGMENGDDGGNGMENGDDGGDDGNGMENGDDGGNGIENGDDGGNGMENGDDGGNGGGAGPTLGETAQWESSFVVEGTITTEQGEATITMRFREGDFYQQIESPQGTFELYKVGDTTYQVVEGQCLKNPSQSMGFGSDFSFDDEEAVTGGNTDLTPDRTETIDGEQMYVYVMEGAEVFISAETGRPRRVKSPQATFDYHSWGNVDPIEAPDMECQEIDSGNGGGYDGGGGGGDDGGYGG